MISNKLWKSINCIKSNKNLEFIHGLSKNTQK